MTAPRRCDSATLDGCVTCGRIMHRVDGRRCDRGHPIHKAHGLCSACESALRRPHPNRDGWTGTRYGRDELLDEWTHLAGYGVSFRGFADKIGLTYPAWERAFYRARKAGHPHARRYDKET